MLFIFDMDDVLYTYRWRERMHSLTEITGLGFHDLRSRWWHDQGEWKAEAGDPDTGEEYLRLVNQALGSSIRRQKWVDIRRAAMEFRPGVAEAVAMAANHGQVTLLTNNGMLIGEHLSEVASELVPLFGDHMFATAHYRARKPDQVVFERVLEKYAVPSNLTFFVDDHPDNIRGAKKSGITSHWFSPKDDGESLKNEVLKFIETRP